VTTLPEPVQNKIDPRCLAKGRPRKEGCDVRMTDAPAPRLVIDFDRPGSPAAGDDVRCDYLVIAEDGDGEGLAVALELKRGQFRAKQTARQLQAGAVAVERLVPADRKIRFRPVAVSGRINKHGKAELKKPENRIAFRGHQEAIRRMSCGDSLKNILGVREGAAPG